MWLNTGIQMQPIKSSNAANNSNSTEKKGMVLPFQPLSLAFNHVNYYVDMPAVSYSFLRLYYEFHKIASLFKFLCSSYLGIKTKT